MSSSEGAEASSASSAKMSSPKTDSETPGASTAPKKPPPESKESQWLRRFVIVSFWAVVVLLGLPVWWKTTAIYRAELPLDQMTEWAEGKVCSPFFPLRIAVEASTTAPDAQGLIHLTQRALDGLNEFSAHQLRLIPAEPPLPSNISQQVVSDGTNPRSDDEDFVLAIRLIPVETGETPRSHLHPYSSVLDIYYTQSQFPLPSSTDSPLAVYIAQELHKLFVEEKAQLAYTLSSTSGAHTVSMRLPSETLANMARQSTRVLKYAPTYHLTFSLFSPSFAPSSWEIEGALQKYLSPLLASFSEISNFTIDTQVQLYGTFSPSIRAPEYNEDFKAWTLRKEDLSGFVNAAEWPLSPSIGKGPTVNFILYVPDISQAPLMVENGGNSWLVPQWGGIHILNPDEKESIPTTLTKDALAPAMHTFSNQLLSLFGLPEAPLSLPLRIGTLKRVRAASLIYSASSTLGALAQVYQKLPSIPVPDTVAQSVGLTLTHLQLACDHLRQGHFQIALEHARIAEAEAEKAFFERSMVGQVYFPDEHKVAVYLPLLGPVAVPLIMAALKEIKSVVSALRGR